jgi:hypothetical protein
VIILSIAIEIMCRAVGAEPVYLGPFPVLCARYRSGVGVLLPVVCDFVAGVEERGGGGRWTGEEAI